MNRRTLIIPIAASAVFFTACHSFFIYHPSRKEYSNPAAADLIRKDVYLRSAGGPRLHGLRLRDPAAPARGALILQFHGNGGNVSSEHRSLVWLTRQGYELLTFDYRGYGKSEGEAERRGIYLDSLEMLRFADQTAQRENLRLIVYGESLGGSVALRAVAELKDRSRIVLVVADSTFASFHDAGRRKIGGCFTPLRCLVPLALSDEYAPLESIADIAPTPIVFIHHKGDPTVPFESGRAAYRLAGEPRAFYVLEGVAHVGWRHPARLAFQEKFAKILEEALKGAP